MALVRLLAWEPPYAAGAALKRQKEKRRNSVQSVLKSLHVFLFPFGCSRAYGVLPPRIRSELPLGLMPHVWQPQILNPLCRAGDGILSQRSRDAADPIATQWKLLLVFN